MSQLSGPSLAGRLLSADLLSSNQSNSRLVLEFLVGAARLKEPQSGHNGCESEFNFLALLLRLFGAAFTRQTAPPSNRQPLPRVGRAVQGAPSGHLPASLRVQVEGLAGLSDLLKPVRAPGKGRDPGSAGPCRASQPSSSGDLQLRLKTSAWGGLC